MIHKKGKIKEIIDFAINNGFISIEHHEVFRMSRLKFKGCLIKLKEVGYLQLIPNKFGKFKATCKSFMEYMREVEDGS